MDKNKLKAHLALLDDKNELVYQKVRESLLNQPVDILEQLEESWETTNNSLLQERLEEIISTYQFNIVKKDFKNWIKNNSDDILEGAVIISKQRFFESDFSKEKQLIEEIRTAAWLEIHNNLTAMEKVKVLNHFMFSVYKFKGDRYYASDYKSFYLNSVITRKKGSPVILAIIYLAIVQKLELPLKPVDLYKNMILAYEDKHSTMFTGNDDGILFYVNPFNQGSIFGKKEIGYYLEQQKIEKKDKFYKPCDNIVVIRRLILDLMKLAEYKKNNSLLSKLRELFIITQDNIE